MNYTKGELTTVDVMKEKSYTWLEARAYIQGIKDSAAPEMSKALKLITTIEQNDVPYDKYDVLGAINIAKRALAKVEDKR